MKRRRIAPLQITLPDENTERAHRNHEERLAVLEDRDDPGVVTDVVLADGVATRISHRLGRVPRMVWPSAVRGAATTGRIEEIRDVKVDRSKQVVLKAEDWGGAITIDVGLL